MNLRLPMSALVFVVLIAHMGFSGQLPDASQQQRPPFPGQQPTAGEENREEMQKDMAKKANQARQGDIKRDTDRLLKLATELKEAVDKSNENTLSLEVIRKSEEIEKLARSVKDKMRAGY